MRRLALGTLILAAAKRTAAAWCSLYGVEVDVARVLPRGVA